MIKFVEAKSPDMERVTHLLSLCRDESQWANRGPLYHLLGRQYTEFIGLPADRAITPCANGGIALEALSRLLGQRKRAPIRWVASAFSFQNIGRGHFADVRFVDCTQDGLLDLDEVKSLPDDSFDGLIVVNPFGLFSDFTAYIEYARANGKALLIDNAAGIRRKIPDWPWQAFSLHHTKPYGMGEGGLALTPADAAEDLYALLNYGKEPDNSADWLNNGKISDIACAFLIDRLEKSDVWQPLYGEQAERVDGLARKSGLSPLHPFAPEATATSWAFRSECDIPIERVISSRNVTLAKYYKPLRPLPRTSQLFAQLVNIPTHPDVARLSDRALLSDLERLLEGSNERTARRDRK